MFLFNITPFCVLACSLLQAFLSTLISILAALPCVYFFNRFSFKGKKLLLSLIPLFCIMPSKLTGLGISVLFGINGFAAIILGHCALNIPLAFYVLYSACAHLNPYWQLIARQLGADQWQAYLDIDLPFLKSAIINATILIFLLCFTSFSLPSILGAQELHMTPDILISQLYQQNQWYQASIFFVLRLIVLLPLCFFSTKSYGSSWLQDQGISAYAEFFSIKKHGWWWLVILGSIFFIVVGPLLAVLWHSLNMQVVLFWRDVIACMPDRILHLPVYQVIKNSILLAFFSGLGSIIFGYCLCFISRNIKSSMVKNTISLASSFVFLLGSVGIGILFAILSQHSFGSKFCIATLCHMILNYPFTYRIIKVHLDSWQPEWDLSAQSFGAGSRERFFTLELPFLRTAFAHAFCIAFGLSLTEVGAGSVLSSETGMTIPMAIRIYREQGAIEGVIGLSMILLGIVFLFYYARIPKFFKLTRTRCKD